VLAPKRSVTPPLTKGLGAESAKKEPKKGKPQEGAQGGWNGRTVSKSVHRNAYSGRGARTQGGEHAAWGGIDPKKKEICREGAKREGEGVSKNRTAEKKKNGKVTSIRVKKMKAKERGGQEKKKTDVMKKVKTERKNRRQTEPSSHRISNRKGSSRGQTQTV